MKVGRKREKNAERDEDIVTYKTREGQYLYSFVISVVVIYKADG